MYQINFNSPIHIYFIGIGGISMSGLAEILLSEGFRISGSSHTRWRSRAPSCITASRRRISRQTST